MNIFINWKKTKNRSLKEKKCTTKSHRKNAISILNRFLLPHFQNNSMTHFYDREKRMQQIELHNRAIERAAKIKEQKSIEIKLRNRKRQERFYAKQLKAFQNDAKYVI